MCCINSGHSFSTIKLLRKNFIHSGGIQCSPMVARVATRVWRVDSQAVWLRSTFSTVPRAAAGIKNSVSTRKTPASKNIPRTRTYARCSNRETLFYPAVYFSALFSFPFFFLFFFFFFFRLACLKQVIISILLCARAQKTRGVRPADGFPASKLTETRLVTCRSFHLIFDQRDENACNRGTSSKTPLSEFSIGASIHHSGFCQYCEWPTGSQWSMWLLSGDQSTVRTCSTKSLNTGWMKIHWLQATRI